MDESFETFKTMNMKNYEFYSIPIVVEPDENFKKIRLPISLVKYIEDLAKIKIKYLEERLEWIMKEKRHLDI